MYSNVCSISSTKRFYFLSLKHRLHNILSSNWLILSLSDNDGNKCFNFQFLLKLKQTLYKLLLKNLYGKNAVSRSRFQLLLQTSTKLELIIEPLNRLFHGLFYPLGRGTIGPSDIPLIIPLFCVLRDRKVV